MKYISPEQRAEFNQSVWKIVRQIPPGFVATYGQIATLIRPPQGVSQGDYRAWGARWVGGAMAACPQDVPWQRVINSQGKISIRPGEGHLRQRQLLEAEGVTFDEHERVNIKKYRWTASDINEIWNQGSLPNELFKGD